jgi:hypothetical protein
MSDESALCAEFLYNKLNVSAITNALGTASRIYDTDIPQEQATSFPCVVYQQQASQDSYGVGAVRIFVRPIWTVKVIVSSSNYSESDSGSYKAASAIFSLVDAALQGQSGTVTGGSVYACYRENQLRYSEAKPAGGYYRHVGATYRLECRATTTP